MNQPPPIRPWKQLSNAALVRFLLLFACGWALLQVLIYFNTIIVIFTSATIIAFLLNYPVSWLRRFMPCSVAVCLVFFSSLILIVGLTITLGLEVLSQGQQLLNSVSDFVNSLNPHIARLETLLQERNIPVNLGVFEGRIRDQILALIGSSLSFFQILLSNLIDLIFVLVVSFYMLLDGRRLWRLILKLVPQTVRSRFDRTVQRKFSGFFRGQLILCSFLTTLTFITFSILGAPFALVLSVVVGIFDLIPGIGATLGIGLVFLILLSQNVWLAFRVLAVCIILQQVQDNLISPRIMGSSVNIHPVVIFFALLVGARVAGVLGIFLSIPVAGVLVSMFEIDEMKGEV